MTKQWWLVRLPPALAEAWKEDMRRSLVSSRPQQDDTPRAQTSMMDTSADDFDDDASSVSSMQTTTHDAGPVAHLIARGNVKTKEMEFFIRTVDPTTKSMVQFPLKVRPKGSSLASVVFSSEKKITIGSKRRPTADLGHVGGAKASSGMHEEGELDGEDIVTSEKSTYGYAGKVEVFADVITQDTVLRHRAGEAMRSDSSSTAKVSVTEMQAMKRAQKQKRLDRILEMRQRSRESDTSKVVKKANIERRIRAPLEKSVVKDKLFQLFDSDVNARFTMKEMADKLDQPANHIRPIVVSICDSVRDMSKRVYFLKEEFRSLQ